MEKSWTNTETAKLEERCAEYERANRRRLHVIDDYRRSYHDLGVKYDRSEPCYEFNDYSSYGYLNNQGFKRRSLVESEEKPVLRIEVPDTLTVQDIVFFKRKATLRQKDLLIKGGIIEKIGEALDGTDTEIEAIKALASCTFSLSRAIISNSIAPLIPSIIRFISRVITSKRYDHILESISLINIILKHSPAAVKGDIGRDLIYIVDFIFFLEVSTWRTTVIHREAFGLLTSVLSKDLSLAEWLNKNKQAILRLVERAMLCPKKAVSVCALLLSAGDCTNLKVSLCKLASADWILSLLSLSDNVIKFEALHLLIAISTNKACFASLIEKKLVLYLEQVISTGDSDAINVATQLILKTAHTSETSVANSKIPSEIMNRLAYLTWNAHHGEALLIIESLLKLLLKLLKLDSIKKEILSDQANLPEILSTLLESEHDSLTVIATQLLSFLFDNKSR